MKYRRCFLSVFLATFLVAAFSGSCTTVQENVYPGTTFEDLIEEKGNPTYSINMLISSDHEPAEFEPNFSDHFTPEEIENTVEVKYVVWKKTHSVLIVWLKNTGDDHWTVFSATEHRGPFLQ